MSTDLKVTSSPTLKRGGGKGWLRRNTLLLLGSGFFAVALGLTAYVFLQWEMLGKRHPAAASTLQTFAGMFLTVGLTFLGLAASTGWLKAVQAYQRHGILMPDEDRDGRDPRQDDLWLDRLVHAKRQITLVGTTLGGWFANEGMFKRVKEVLPVVLHDVSVFRILLLKVDSGGFQVRAAVERRNIEDDMASPEDTLHDTRKRHIATLKRLVALLKSTSIAENDKQKIKIYLYDSTPLSVNWFDDSMFQVTYLPEVLNENSPELELNVHGRYAARFAESIEKLIASSACTLMRLDTLEAEIRRLERLQILPSAGA